MFKEITGDSVLLRHNGTFRVSPLYTYRSGVYAKLGTGYVRLRTDNTTSKDGVAVEFLESDKLFGQDKFGRLTFGSAAAQHED